MILTPADIKSRSFDKSQPDWESTDTVPEFGISYKDIAENVISEIEREIETYLDRKLSIKDRIIFIDSWQLNSDGRWETYPRHFPIVQIETSGVNKLSGSLIESSQRIGSINAFTGYKHHSQTLADLQTEYSDLQNEPENYPADIQRVALNLVFFELKKRSDNLYGQSSRTLNTGQANITVDRQDTGFVDRELSKLDTYRWLA